MADRKPLLDVDDDDELLDPMGEDAEAQGLSQVPYGKVGGLGVLAGTAFLFGEMAGSGILALPKAVVNANWIGLPLIFICGVLAAYNGINLGRCWNIMLERWPQYRNNVRDPYPAMAEQAFGKPMKYIVRVCMHLTLFGVATVVLLLASQNIQSILDQFGAKHISFCYWLIIIAALLTPCTWLGTPKNFWPIATGAGLATILAGILTVVAIWTDSRYFKAIHTGPKFESLFSAFGAILFVFGGASTFPTVQHDMKEPKKFKYAAFAAFSFAAAGFFAYGDAVQTNILQSLPPGGLRITIEILVTGHLVLAFVIIVNPMEQDLEEWLNIPLHFNWKRAVLRTVLVGFILFAAQSVPHFGAIMDLIGGSTVTFLTFVAPPLFYLKFKSMHGYWFYNPLPLHIKVLNVEIIIIGVIGGVASTYSAILELSSKGTFVPPCYVNMNAAEGHG